MHATADPGKGKERYVYTIYLGETAATRREGGSTGRYPDLGRRAAVGGREMTFEMWTSVLAGERIPSLSRVPENIVPGRQFPGQRRREQWDLSNNLGAPVSITSIGAQVRMLMYTQPGVSYPSCLPRFCPLSW